MGYDAVKNFALATVSTGYDDTDTTVDLASGHGAKFPSAPFNVTWWDSTVYPDPDDDPNVEIVRVTAITTDQLTITRAQEGTSAKTHNTTGSTYKMLAGITAKTITERQGNKFIPLFMSPRAGSAGIWTNMPAAETELFGETGNRARADLSRFTEVRTVVSVITAGYSGAGIGAMYHPGTSWTALVSSFNAAVIDATGVKVGIWVAIPAGALDNVSLRAVGYSGDGIVDPAFGYVGLEFR